MDRPCVRGRHRPGRPEAGASPCDPRCVLVIFETVAPFRGVEVRGEARLDDRDVTEHRRSIAGRYLGTEAGEAVRSRAGGEAGRTSSSGSGTSPCSGISWSSCRRRRRDHDRPVEPYAQRDRDPEARPAAVAVGGRDPAAVALDDPAGDGEAEARTAVGRARRALEPVEDLDRSSGRMPGPIVVLRGTPRCLRSGRPPRPGRPRGCGGRRYRPGWSRAVGAGLHHRGRRLRVDGIATPRDDASVARDAGPLSAAISPEIDRQSFEGHPRARVGPSQQQAGPRRGSVSWSVSADRCRRGRLDGLRPAGRRGGAGSRRWPRIDRQRCPQLVAASAANSRWRRRAVRWESSDLADRDERPTGVESAEPEAATHHDRAADEHHEQEDLERPDCSAVRSPITWMTMVPMVLGADGSARGRGSRRRPRRCR